MPSTYSDAEIEALLAERKSRPAGSAGRLRPKLGHEERDISVTGAGGNEFRVILRQNKINRLDFSAILAALVPQSNLLFRLRRYNGKSHQHTNQLEGDSFYDFHIHMATQRYQELGMREDAFAEPSHRYADLGGAVRCLVRDANLVTPLGEQGDLFGEV